MNIEDLKCCGNCKKFDEESERTNFSICITIAGHGCSDWEWDQLTADERKQ